MFPGLAKAPLTLFTLCIVQLNVVDGTLLGLLIGIDVVCPLQMAASDAVAFGIRLTVSNASLLVNVPHVPVMTTL